MAINKLVTAAKATYHQAKTLVETLIYFVELCVTNPTAAWRVVTLFNNRVFDINYESDPVILEAVMSAAKTRNVTAQEQFNVLRVANALHPYAGNYRTVQHYADHLFDI